MKDYVVYELETAEDIDAAFAKTFGITDTGASGLQWAQTCDTDAATDFLEGLTGERKIREWILLRRIWGYESDFVAEVTSVHRKRGEWGKDATMLGVSSVKCFSNFACHAIMKAAIDWDQRRRAQQRERMAAKRAGARATA